MAGTIQKATRKDAAPVSGKALMQGYITQMKGEIEKALPSVITPERFTRIVMSALSTNPKLAETTPQSFLGAMMTAAQLGVEPNTPLGQAYLIPYKNKGVMECQFQLGYKGMMDLAYRSGQISTIQSQVVYQNDEFDYSFGLEPTLRHVPAKSNRGEATHVYAVWRTKDGSGYGFEVMSMEDVRTHAQKFSKTFGFGPWQSNFEEMAKKTVLKKALKYAPMKSDFVRGMAQDGTVHTTIEADMMMAEDVYNAEDVIEVDQETGEVIDNKEVAANAE